MGAVVPFRRPAPSADSYPARVRAIFDDVLPAAWPGYAARVGQLAMVDAVSLAIDRGEHVVVEAPCGTGKSLAYLVPAILRARATGHPVLIATASIALQEQLIAKDLPALRDALTLPGGPLRFALLKGRSNYLCKNSLDEAEVPMFLGPEERDELAAVDRWGRTTQTGDRAELPIVVRDGVWNLRTVGTDDCLRDGCTFFEGCHARRARAAADEADVVVVNMHLLCAHIAVHIETAQDVVLPKTGERGTRLAWDTLVLDEAHELNDVSREFFGCDLTLRAFERVVRWLRRDEHDDAHEAAAVALERAAGTFFTDLDTRVPKAPENREADKVRVREGLDTEALVAALRDARDRAASVVEAVKKLKEDGELELVDRARLRRAESVVRRVERACSWLDAAEYPAEHPGLVLWLEARTVKARRSGRPVRVVALQGRHIDPGPILGKSLWGRARTVVATSATLTTGSGADGWRWILRQMGAPEGARTVVVPSPFDFAAQARLVLPAGMPDPTGHTREAFDVAVSRVAARVAAAAQGARGGTLVLCTSHRMCARVAEACRAAGLARVMAQGEAPRATQLAAMRAAPSVLVGTTSLWTGVDLPGDALVAVVLDKIPFPQPGDPVQDAIKEALAAATGDEWAAFREEQLPRAILRLRQGAGRLVRSAACRGLVVLCDPRVTTKRYGGDVLRAIALPRRSTGLDDGLTWLTTGHDQQGALL